jgi:hypothetical protein
MEGRSVTLFGALQQYQTHKSALIHSGASIPKIVRRSFQDPPEADVSAVIGVTCHERCPDERYTQRSGCQQIDRSS